MEIIWGRETWLKKPSGKGSTGRPCRKTQWTLFRSVTNAKGSPMSQDNPPNCCLLSSALSHSQNGEYTWSAHAQAKFAIRAIDYFTKWVEAEPLSTITKAKCTNFIWSNIICRFGVLRSIVTDNRKQFDNPALKEMCKELGIHKLFSTPGHSQANGQVEAVNKTIKDNLKKKLERLKGT